MEVEEFNSDYNEYLKVVQDIQTTQNESWKSVERLLYAIASGALALSITLLTVIIDNGAKIHCKGIVIISWFALIASILANLYSHYKSYNATKSAISQIFSMMSSGVGYDPEKINCIINKENTSIRLLNTITIISLGVGIVGIFVFHVIQMYNNN